MKLPTTQKRLWKNFYPVDDTSSVASSNMIQLYPGAFQSKNGNWFLPHNAFPLETSPEYVDPNSLPSKTSSGLPLYDHQIIGASRLLSSGPGHLLADDVGLGKEQPIDTKVLTPNGWVELGSIVSGDFVVGSDGQPTRVTGVFPQGVKRCYRVSLSDGASVEAGEDHLWAVDRWKKYGASEGRRMGKERLVLTTQQLKDRPVIQIPKTEDRRKSTYNLEGKTLFIPLLSEPVEYATGKALFIPGYLLGQLIANGDCAASTPKITTFVDDWPEVEMYLREVDTPFGSIKQYKNVIQANVLGGAELLWYYGLEGTKSREKFIPAAYLIAPIKERIALFHGLMDADGSVSKSNNRITYHTLSRELAYDFRVLVEGLGGIAVVHEHDRWREDKPVEYVICVRMPSDIPPFRIARKLSKYKVLKSGAKTAPRRTVQSVEYSRSTECVCISVAAEDNLYVTERFILTHNSIQVCHVLDGLKQFRPFLIVSIQEAHRVWTGPDSDAAKYYGLKVEQLRGRTNDIEALFESKADGYFINFQILGDWIDVISMWVQPKIVIIDEIHEVRNVRTKTHKACLRLCRQKQVYKRFGLTATPIVNNLADIYGQLNLVQPRHWGTFVDFAGQSITSFGTRYCNGYMGEYGWILEGESNVDELRKRLESATTRRTQQQVNQHLPQKIRNSILIKEEDFDNNEYEKAKTGAYDKALPPGTKGEVLQRLGRMCLGVSLAKIKPTLKRVQELITAGHTRIIVLSYFQRTCSELVKKSKKQLKGCMVVGPYHGGTPKTRREEHLASFGRTSGEFPIIFFATIKTVGAATNDLVVADRMVVSDLFWVPMRFIQAEGRICRTGQKAAKVGIDYIQSDTEIDRKLFEHLERKSKAMAVPQDSEEALGLVEDLGGAVDSSVLKDLILAVDGMDDKIWELM